VLGMCTMYTPGYTYQGIQEGHIHPGVHLPGYTGGHIHPGGTPTRYTREAYIPPLGSQGGIYPTFRLPGRLLYPGYALREAIIPGYALRKVYSHRYGLRRVYSHRYGLREAIIPGLCSQEAIIPGLCSQETINLVIPLRTLRLCLGYTSQDPKVISGLIVSQRE